MTSPRTNNDMAVSPFFSSPAVYGWDGVGKGYEPDSSGFLPLELKHPRKPDESGSLLSLQVTQP